MITKFNFNYLLRIFSIIFLFSSGVFPAFASLPKLNSFLSNNAAPRFLPVEQAFVFNYTQQNENVLISWDILDGYYLYQDKIAVTPIDAEIKNVILPTGLPYEDEFFGKVNIYRNQLEIPVSLLNATGNSSLSINYQGCADAGFCYPPESITVQLQAITTLANSDINENIQPLTNTIVTSLANNWWQPLLFFALGIGLAFTPCVLPMYPILTGIVLGGGQKSGLKIFTLSMLYVQGMALTYTALGLIVASAGLEFQAALQHPYVLLSISILFVVLAAAMFGMFSLRMPASVQTRLANLSNQQKGGSYGGVFAMGAISGLICSPCTTAPLSGALLYVAQSGDLLTGAITLYALAIGMGVPLILVAMFGNKLLPKAGLWMEKVKTLFGFILLAAPLFFLERFLVEEISAWLWISWLVVTSSWLYHTSQSISSRKIASLVAIIAILGLNLSAFQGYQRFFKPEQYAVEKSLPFIKIKTVADLEAELAKAQQLNKAVMLDFYADWCVACKQFEKYTFSDLAVTQALSNYILLQADVTQNDEQDVALLKRMQVLGLPTIDFWNNQGDYLANARLSGFVNAEDFLQYLINLSSN